VRFQRIATSTAIGIAAHKNCRHRFTADRSLAAKQALDAWVMPANRAKYRSAGAAEAAT
jgi:hypothetical protein